MPFYNPNPEDPNPVQTYKDACYSIQAQQENKLFTKIAVAVAFITGFGAGITFMILFVGGCHVQP